MTGAVLSSRLTPEGYARTVRRQRAWLNEIANRIEQGEPLDKLERSLVAQIVRGRADRMDESLPRKPGRAPRANWSAVALEFELLVRAKKMSKSAARGHLAEKYDVSIEAVRQGLKKNGAAAGAVLDVLRYPSK